VFGFGRKKATGTVAVTDDGLRTLRAQVEDMESAMRRLKGEWLDTLDRIEHLVERQAKRAQRAAERDERQVVMPAVNGRPAAGGPDPVSAGILARRRSPWARPGGGG
jgi:hypothetical protein